MCDKLCKCGLNKVLRKSVEDTQARYALLRLFLLLWCVTPLEHFLISPTRLIVDHRSQQLRLGRFSVSEDYCVCECVLCDFFPIEFPCFCICFVVVLFCTFWWELFSSVAELSQFLAVQIIIMNAQCSERT